MSMTVEEFLTQWESQGPTARVTPAERRFIEDMRKAFLAGVGYGWMQSVIELEWNATCPHGGWGPRWFAEDKQKAVDKLKAIIKQANERLTDMAAQQDYPTPDEIIAIVTDLNKAIEE